MQESEGTLLASSLALNFYPPSEFKAKGVAIVEMKPANLLTGLEMEQG